MPRKYIMQQFNWNDTLGTTPITDRPTEEEGGIACVCLARCTCTATQAHTRKSTKWIF